jgi:hypothetical protein
MKKWKLIIEHNNHIKELVVTGERYSDVYIDAKIEYTGCIIIEISEILSGNVPYDITLN